MTEGAKGLNAFQNLDLIYTDIAISTDWLILQVMSKLCQAPLLMGFIVALRLKKEGKN